uniref:Fe2OG dioxygenase domain-containing protein n=1 Tax=Oryza glumipatula TaxID=40148 RepID=A0A0D9ZKE2_9ORYZ
MGWASAAATCGRLQPGGGGGESSSTTTTRTTQMDPSCPPFPQPEAPPLPLQLQLQPGLPGLELPTLDLERVGGEDRAALVAACRDLGAFRVVNHGVPGELRRRLLELGKQLLGRDTFELKKARPGYFWGTAALKSLRVKEVNWLEGLHVDLVPGSSSSSSQVGDGDDDDDDGWMRIRALMAEYGDHMARIARKLFDALAAELGLDHHQAASYLAERQGFLRLYRYPPCPSSASCLGMEPHTDSSVLSIILDQDHVGGLQVMRDGAWRDVAPAPGELLVNLGDMMTAISGGSYQSVRHRVLASRPSTERVSCCYFAFPQEDAVVEAPSGIGGGVYRPFSYREFREQVQADIKAVGTKVGLSRFYATATSAVGCFFRAT